LIKSWREESAIVAAITAGEKVIFKQNIKEIATTVTKLFHMVGVFVTTASARVAAIEIVAIEYPAFKELESLLSIISLQYRR
jgi:hypothetical protein